MKAFRILLIILLIIGFIIEMLVLTYADTTRIDGAITLKAGLILLISIPLSGFLMYKSLLMLWLTKDEGE